jgi:hypothetical protein
MKPFVNIDSLTEKREVTDGAGFNATLFPIGMHIGANPSATFPSKFYVESSDVDCWHGEK